MTQTLTVTGVALDATNASSVPDGKSGTLTFNSATAPVNGDALIAVNAPKILRPVSHITTAQMTGGDVLTMGLVQDCISYLRDNGVPPMDDGSYHCILDNTSMRQLWADQDFKVLFAGRYDSGEYKDGDIIRLIGVTFIPTTETYVQPALQQYNGATYGASGSGSGSGVAAVNVRIRRAIVCGAEHLIQGHFEGMDMWIERQGVNSFAEIFLVNNVAHIIRPPLDRLQQTASLSWIWIGAFAVPTDLTATTSIIPTASNSLYKRCVVIEHAG